MSVVSVEQSTIQVKGKPVFVPSTCIQGRTVISNGRWVKVASVRHEELVEGDTVAHPPSFIEELKTCGLKADLLTFAQRIPETVPKFNYHIEWETAAAIPITSFAQWWKNAPYSTRKAVNRAEKLGVVVKEVEFNDEFVASVCPIFNEVPVRQGRAFWHYGKDFETVKRELDNYLDRSIFLGAYHEDALIGFVKITSVGPTGALTQILSMRQHFDKKPNNALIAKALKVCEAKGCTHFLYGNYVYHDPNSTLTGFKRHNGFEAVPLPRYFVPLTIKGWIILRLGLHRNVKELMPKRLLNVSLRIRKAWCEYRLKAGKTLVSARASNEAE